MSDAIAAGDWVSIRARVIQVNPNGDLIVQLFSKTDQFQMPVRPDVCEKIETPLPREPMMDGSVVYINTPTLERPMVFQRAGDDWFRAGSADPYTWRELCDIAEGEPEILAP